MLIKAGANIEAKDWRGETALYRALHTLSFMGNTSQSFKMVQTILETIPLSEKEQIEKARACVPVAIHSVKHGLPKPPKDICKVMAKEIQASTIRALVNKHMHYALTLLAHARSIAIKQQAQSMIKLIDVIESPDNWQIVRKNVALNIRLILSGKQE